MTRKMTGKLGKHGFLAAWSLLLVACGGNVQSPDFVSKLEDIQLSPTTASIKLGDTLQLRVNGLYSLPPGSTGGVACPATSASERCETRPMAGSTFSVDKADLATIDGNGLLKANKRGTVVVSAKSGDITRSANVGITGVVLCDITITPAQASVALGRSQGFSANGVFSENCASTTASRSTGTISGTITWSSSNTGVAAITAQGQRDTVASTMGKTVGQTTIRASAADAEGTTVTSSDASAATLTVTVAELERLNISPSGLSIARGQQGVFNLTGTYSDGNTRIVSPETVAWTVGGGNDTADTNVRIDDQTNSAARLTALSSGTVGASSLVRATATKPDSSTVNVTGTVTISNAVLTGIQQITPDNLSIPQGNTLQYNVTGMFSDGTSGVVDTTQFPVDWISSDPIVASIDITTGLATPGNTEAAIGGTTTITVTLRNGVAPGATPRTDTTTLTVTDQICRVPFTTANAGTTGTGTGGGAASGCLSTAANACTITNAGNLVTPSRDDSAQFNIARAHMPIFSPSCGRIRMITGG